MKDKVLKAIPKLMPTPIAVSPQMASDWLENKANNRKINDRRVCQYARDMEHGTWWPVSMIVFDENGQLIDGEHRLKAIVKSGKTVIMLVLWGAEVKWREGIDMGQPRKPAQCLHMFCKMQNSNNVVATERIVLAAKTRDSGFIPSLDELNEEYSENKETYDKAVAIFMRGRKRGFSLLAGFTAGIFLVLKYGVEDENGRRIFDDFANKILTGEELKKGSPCLAIRAALLRSKHSGGGRPAMFCQALWVLKAWEDFVCGNERNLFKEPNSPWLDFLAAHDRLKAIREMSVEDSFEATAM